MYLNSFSVRIVGGKEQPGGYVELNHNQQYSITMRNDRSMKCDTRVEVDGKHIGTYQIDPCRSITIERPVHSTGRLTFFVLGTKEANDAQLDASDPNLGLVKVTFTPEKQYRPVWHTTYPSRPVNPWPPYVPPYTIDWDLPYTITCDAIHGNRYELNGFAGGSWGSANVIQNRAGGTGLTGVSEQSFYNVPNVLPDYSQQTVIHLRLVAKRADDGAVRPLTAYSTPVPPMVR